MIRTRGTLRSIAAVVAGLLFIFVVTTVADFVMHAVGIFPPWFQPMSTGLWLVALGYRVIIGIVGGFITAKLAPSRPIFHALVLGIIGVFLSTIGAVATWNQGPEFGPKWYPLSLVAIAVPCAWFGGRLASRK